MVYYVLLFLIGLLGGFLAGLIGIGGGIIYVLVLPYVLAEMGIPESEIVQYTIANSILGTMFAGLAGNVTHIRRKHFFWKPVLMIGFVGVIFSMISVEFVVNTDWYQKEQFNPLIISIAVFIIYRTLRQAHSKVEVEKERRPGTLGWGAIGAMAGSIAALSGLGGGIVIIPSLNSGLKMTMHKAKSISLGAIFITALAISIMNLIELPQSPIGHPSIGYIILPIGAALALGVSIASPIGVKVADRFSNRLISYIFVLFLFFVIIDKLLQVV